jgi:DEAD/DEAH box helicase domain-containing protein
MSNEVVLDIETQNTFQEVGGFKTDKLKISVVCAYFYETDTYECYEEHELGQFYKRLELSGRLIGYNSLGFDLPVMNNYYAGDFLTFSNLDLLKEIHKSLGFRLKLDDVAAATVGHRKSGHGLQAVEWWKQGEVQKIKDYCTQDVKVTKDVYEYGKKYGALAYEDRLGGRKAIPVDFSEKEPIETTINLSMGF